MMIKARYKLIIFILMFWSSLIQTTFAKPIAVDSRIRTLVYSENDVFRVVIHHGYQTSIEFANDEEIQTIFLGNNYAWQLNPLGRRLFIRAIEEDILTNMTLITNKHVYQFEIESKGASQATVDSELAYVIRFFYPDDVDKVLPKINNYNDTSAIPTIKPYNFNYTLTGPDAIAPIKVFDDDINTYLEFDIKLTKKMPDFYEYTPSGIKLLVVNQRGGYVVLPKIAKKFLIKDGNKKVNLFNENYK